MRRFSITLCTILFIASVSTAQVAVGTQPFGSFGGGPFDSVDQGNLNVHFSIPVFHKAGRGVPFNYDLGYNNSVWTPVSSSGTFSWQPVFNWGWSPSYTANTGHVSYKLNIHICKDPDGITGNFSSKTNWVYHDAHNVDHLFSGSTTVATGSCGSVNDTSFTSTATDGSRLTLVVTNNGSNAQIITASGSTIVPGLQLGSGGTAASVIASDSNGNQITSNGSGVFTDTLGVTALTVTGSGTTTSPIALTYTPPSGTLTQYTINSVQYTVRTNFGVTTSTGAVIAEYGPNSVALVDNITLPDQSKYTFTYEVTPGACTPLSGTFQANCVTGRIASVTLPTGGKITYTYNGGPNGTGVFNDGSTAGLVRVLSPSTSCTSGGCWQYTRTLLTGSPGAGATWKTTVIDPASNNTVINFAEDGNTTAPTYSLFETQRQLYQGSIAPADLLQTIIHCYNSNFANCGSATVSTPISQVDAYSQLPNGSTRLSEMQYNGVASGSGLLSQDREYDYGVSLGAIPGTSHLIRETIITWQALSNNVNRQTNVKVNDWTTGSAVLRSSTTYTYDASAPTVTANTPQHVTVTGARGNVTTIASQVNSTTTLYRQFTYYDTGTVNTASGTSSSSTATCASNPTACTTYNYSATNNASCGNSFVTSVTEPLGLTHATTWNCTGGVATQVTDENSQSVSTGFSDAGFWRPSIVIDQLTNQSSITYINQTASEASLTFNGGTSEAGKRSTMDGFGRAILGQRLQGPGASNYDTVETDFNSIGLASRTTLPFSAPAGATNSTAPGVTTTYDALRRVLTRTAADGGRVSYTYTNNDVLQKVSGAQIFQKQFEYDGLGRLVSVCEITTAAGSGACGQSSAQNGLLTKYVYDGVGNLTGVTQNAQAASGSQQTRSFGFDMLARLTSEQNPETGLLTYIYDSWDAACGTFASAGDLVEKKDAAGNVTCMQYDALHRKTQVTYPSGPNSTVTPTKTFVYDTTTFSCPAALQVNGNVAGRLAEAFTGSSTSKITDIGFCYSARGELTDVFQSTPHSAGVYHTTATYWPNSVPQSLSGVGGFPAIAYGVDAEGRLSSAQHGTTKIVCDSSCSQSSTTYNTASQPLTIHIGGGGDNDTYTYDPNTGRMSTYTFTVGSTPTSVQGTLTWNSNGTLQTLAIGDGSNSSGTQTCTYSHDDLGRMSSVNCVNSSNTNVWGQTFSYDPFGNVTKQVPTGATGIAWMPGYNSSTNRYTLSGTSYDANGNVLKDTFHTYTWDSDGHVATIDSTVCGTNGTCLTYDALGRMVEKNVSGTFTEIMYSPVGKTAVMSGQTASLAYFPLPGGATEVEMPGGTHHFLHKDWLGSARLVSTASTSSVVAVDRAFAPFGETYKDLHNLNEVDFTGDTQETLAGLYDTSNREYHPKQGRWLSPDPGGMGIVNPRDPQSWNRYAYVGNSPLVLADSTGLGWDDGLPLGIHGTLAQSQHPESPTGRGGGGGGSGTTCLMDEVQTDCSLVQSSLDSGASVVCPNNACSGVDENGRYGQFVATLEGGSYAILAQSGAVEPPGVEDSETREAERERENDKEDEPLQTLFPGQLLPGGYQYSLLNPGPLGDDVAANFAGGQYSEMTIGDGGLSVDTPFWRVYGGEADAEGSWYALTAQVGGIQSQIDLALNPAWGNTASNVICVYLPPGTQVYVGPISYQGGFALGGGPGLSGLQVYVPH